MDQAQSKKYQIIYADPPWQYGSKELYGDKDVGGKRKNRFRDLSRIYKTMTISEIKELAVCNIIEKNAACFMWTTDSHIKEAIAIMESWGFKYKTIGFIWLKHYNTGTRVYNLAPWTLKSTEVCLFGTRGTMGKYKARNDIKQLIEAERTHHSAKPPEARKRIEQLFGDLPRIELFARQKTTGWDVWGNEVESDIELTIN